MLEGVEEGVEGFVLVFRDELGDVDRLDIIQDIRAHDRLLMRLEQITDRQLWLSKEAGNRYVPPGSQSSCPS